CAIAEKHPAVPIKTHDGTLLVSMIDPRNVNALDEISFATGYAVKPWVSPEARILQALNRLYGAPIRDRYTRLCRKLDASAESKRAAATPGPSPSSGGRTGTAPGTSQGEPQVHQGSQPDPDLGGEYGLGRPWTEIAAELDIK